MSDRPTPETDAAWRYPKLFKGRECVSSEFARRLEIERDEARKELNEIKAERDLAKLSSMESDQIHDHMVGELEKVYDERNESRMKNERANTVIEKAKELISRWDQPSWKDTTPTAGFINALRDSITEYEKW